MSVVRVVPIEPKKENGETGYGGEKPLMDSGLKNRKPRVTLIQRLDGSVFLLGPTGEKIEFKIGKPIQEIRAKAARFGWEVGVEHLPREKMRTGH